MVTPGSIDCKAIGRKVTECPWFVTPLFLLHDPFLPYGLTLSRCNFETQAWSPNTFSESWVHKYSVGTSPVKFPVENFRVRSVSSNGSLFAIFRVLTENMLRAYLRSILMPLTFHIGNAIASLSRHNPRKSEITQYLTWCQRFGVQVHPKSGTHICVHQNRPFQVFFHKTDFLAKWSIFVYIACYILRASCDPSDFLLHLGIELTFWSHHQLKPMNRVRQRQEQEQRQRQGQWEHIINLVT